MLDKVLYFLFVLIFSVMVLIVTPFIMAVEWYKIRIHPRMSVQWSLAQGTVLNFIEKNWKS